MGQHQVIILEEKTPSELKCQEVPKLRTRSVAVGPLNAVRSGGSEMLQEPSQEKQSKALGQASLG